MPSLRTGIAQYTSDLLHGLGGAWPVHLLAEGESSPDPIIGVDRISTRQFDPQRPTVIQLGNSEYHALGLELARSGRHLVVLHDVILHHALLSLAVRRRRTRQYRALLRETYGPKGDELASRVLKGQAGAELLEYPLSEPMIERARATIVHNHGAAGIVNQLVPGAEVFVVPMGVPLPALTPQADARCALGIVSGRFVVASITHVNPMKRLDVVLRAMRSVVREIPDALLIIAGSVAPEVDLEGLARRQGLERHVQIWGYVDDDHARLLARAADVCVNLRYPTTGETSASLLRLLGAGRPVIVSDGMPEEDLPLGVGLRAPVDRFEVEMVAELLLALARDEEFRKLAGRQARTFIEQHHTLRHMIEGYRDAIEQAYGISLPMPTGDLALHEAEPSVEHTISQGAESLRPPTYLDMRLGEAIMDLGIDSTPAVNDAASAAVQLGLNGVSLGEASRSVAASTRVDRLLPRMACPHCGGSVDHTAGRLICSGCGRDLGTINLPDGRIQAESV